MEDRNEAQHRNNQYLPFSPSSYATGHKIPSLPILVQLCLGMHWGLVLGLPTDIWLRKTMFNKSS